MKKLEKLCKEDREIVESVKDIDDDGMYVIRDSKGKGLCGIEGSATGLKWKKIVNETYYNEEEK